MDGKSLFKGFLLTIVLPISVVGFVQSTFNNTDKDVIYAAGNSTQVSSGQSNGDATIDLAVDKGLYSKEEYQAAIAKYFPAEHVGTWLDIFWCESSGNSQAIGDGGRSWGAAQINNWWYDNGYVTAEMWNKRMTLDGSLKIAFEISKGINGGSAVSGYNYYTHPINLTKGVGGHYTYPWSCAKINNIPTWLP